MSIICNECRTCVTHELTAERLTYVCVFVPLVRAVSVGSEDALSEHVLYAERQPRMSTLD